MVNLLIKIYNQLKGYPFGKAIFSNLFALKAPYFLTIRPRVINLEPGNCSVSMKPRWAVQNHIKTVHAIAVCNLVEMCMGLAAETTIPKHLRWLPMGMDINYKKKAVGVLTATANIDPNTHFTLEKYPGRVDLPVEVKNDKGELISNAIVRLWVSLKPAEKSA